MLEEKPYDAAVFVGRFRPFHVAHKRVADEALRLGKRVIILVGSSNAPRGDRNPFLFEEVRDMIWGVYGPEIASGRLILDKLPDEPDDDLWVLKVKQTVLRHMPGNSDHVTLHGCNDFKIALMGWKKDSDSYWLDLFPQWTFTPVPPIVSVNATDIRKSLFQEGTVSMNLLPPEIVLWLARWCTMNDVKVTFIGEGHVHNPQR